MWRHDDTILGGSRMHYMCFSWEAESPHIINCLKGFCRYLLILNAHFVHNINTCHAHCTVGCNFEDLEAILKPWLFHHPIIAHVNMALNSESDVFCKHSECVNAQDNKNIGHCLICHAAFHFSCTGVKNKATFVCSPCSGAVKSAQTIQDSVLALNKTLLENVKLITKLQNDLAVKHQECPTLKD